MPKMSDLYTELNGTAALAYAEALDNALIRDVATGTGFTFLHREKSGRYYWYLQHGFAKKRRQYYVGPDDEPTRARIEQQKARWEAGKLEAPLMEKLVSMAVVAGCNPIQARAYRVLSAAANTGLFHAGGVLVGSYAFLAIGNMLGVSWRRDTTVTQDVDLAASDAAMIAIPPDVKPLGEVILESETGLLSVPMTDPKNPSTSFKVQGQDFRVDLITPQVGKPSAVKYVRAIKSYAEPVAFLEYLLEDTQKALLLHKAGVIVNVPTPGRFALHKLVVSQRRPATERAKANKDRAQAAQVIACLLSQSPGDLWMALDAAMAHPAPKFMKQLKAGLELLEDAERVPLVEYIAAEEGLK